MPVLAPVDETFFDLAPTRFLHRWSIPRSSAQVWAELVGERPLHWCRGLAIRWTSPTPFSVGTTRQATALGGLKVQEHFFIWEQGRRHAFYVTESNLPLFHNMAEDYLVEPDGPNRCTFTWRVALTPTTLGKLGGPLNRWLFTSFFNDTSRHFDTSRAADERE